MNTYSAPKLPYAPLREHGDDPAWPKPVDPLRDAKAGVVARELPLTTTNTHWSWGDVRHALDDLSIGFFERPGQLIESLFWNARVQAAMGSRTGGLLGREAKFMPSQVKRVKGSRAAKECFDAWVEAWPQISNTNAFAKMHQWGVMAFALGQLLWDFSVYPHIPYLEPFNIRFTYYQPTQRALIAITMDGVTPVTPGDGHWVLNAPYGKHRGWMHGAISAIAQPWLQRNFAYRDFARFCERHGFPLYMLGTPAVADPDQIAKLVAAIANIGQESILQAPQGVEDGQGYKLDTVEPKSTVWQAFPQSIELCDADIQLAILWQNLTTEIKEGSFAAARMHGDVRQAAIEFDNLGESRWIYGQVARPFAFVNYGDPELAPWTSRVARTRRSSPRPISRARSTRSPRPTRRT